MADGGPRFHQTGAGVLQPSQDRQSNRNLLSAPSPSTPRSSLSRNLPSPSRSPANTSRSATSRMYGHNGYQGQHNMMNGGQNHQRYGLHMPKYQAGHHNHHNQVNQHHQPHHGGHIGHQHTHSSGFPTSTSHMTNYGHDHLQNGNGDSGQHDDLDDQDNEHWREQKRQYEDTRDLMGPNQRARTVAAQSKSFGIGSLPEPNPVFLPNQDNEDRPIQQTRSDTGNNWHELDLGGQGLQAISPVLFNAYAFIQRLDLNHNNLTSLPPAIGQLKNLQYLDLSWNRLQELPEEIGMLTNLKTLQLFENEIVTLPYELGYLYKLEMLGVLQNPLEPGQKDKITEGGTKALITYLRESMPEPPPPREREWHQLEAPMNGEAKQETFKALTYNILCEKAATPHMYGYVPERILSWSYRKTLIMDEIVEVDADIVCLQELDKASYDEYFRGELSKKGYKGYYQQRGRAATMGDAAKFVDGCGTFWRDKKYVCLANEHLILGRKAIERPGARQSADMINRVWQKDHIAVVSLLENRLTGSRIIVVNAHTLWDPTFKDVKLIQTAVLMDELSKLADKWAKHGPATNKKMFKFSEANSNDDESDEPEPEPGPSMEYANGLQIPMIICADLNSNAESAVWNLLAKKTLEPNHPDFEGRKYGYWSEGLTHNLTLKSAYSSIDEMPFTNYTPSFVDTLDYIWYSSNTLRTIGLLGEVDPLYLKRVPGFPNFHFPSDHLALVAEFKVEKLRPQGKVIEPDFGPSSSSGGRK